jgi:hypothetical protein
MDKMNNTVPLKTHHTMFKLPGLRLSVSSRRLNPDMNIIDYLKIFYMYTSLDRIDSVFGNTIERSRLYGGRTFKTRRSLTDKNVADLEEHGINISLTLTNHFFDEDSYKESRDMLKRHHKKGNSIICINDELARRIRQDFPDYIIKASIIKDTDTIEKIEECLELYDETVLPMQKNDDDEFLNSIREKRRIVLFGNATCAYTCPDRSCYLGFSQRIARKKVTSWCSQQHVPRLDVGNVFFDIKKLKSMGFSQYKLVPIAPAHASGITTLLSGKSREMGEERKLVAV